ncbi:MAG: hypothetical protein ACR2GH_18565 [Pseudonocardia sp.]
MSTPFPGQVEALSIKASGPATQGGRISLSELARITSGFQATLERIAYSILIGYRRQGRLPKEIVDAVRIDFVGFREGSVVLDLRRPGIEALDDLFNASFEALVSGLKFLQGSPSELPPHFNTAVINGILTMCGGISQRNISEISFSAEGQTYFTLNAGMRAVLRAAQRRGSQQELTIIGRLHMGDFDPLSLRCRIDTHSGSVSCDLDDELRDDVLDLIDTLVIASGVAEMQADGSTVRVLHLSDIEELETSTSGSLDGLAHQQGILPVASIETLRGKPVDDFEAFMEIVRSAR